MLAAIAACHGPVPANESGVRRESAPFPTDVLAIQATASAYLKAHRDEALSHVPADWAPLVPENAARPVPSRDPGYLLPPWRLQLDRERAVLRYTPQARMTTDHRFWFELRFEKGAGGWQLTRDGLVFGHAWRRR